MENASKALLIAGGVLIAILVATLGVYFAQRMSIQNSRIYAQLEEHARTEFNQQFLKYEGVQINIQDIATIINLAKDNNESGGSTTVEQASEFTYYIQVEMHNIGVDNDENINAESMDRDQVAELLTKNMMDSTWYNKKYGCTIEINPSTGYVNKITIQP